MRSAIVSLAALAAGGAAFAQAPVQATPAAPAPAPVPISAPAPAHAPVAAAPFVPPRNAVMPKYVNPNAAPPAPVRTPAPPAAPLPPVAGLPADAPKVVINGGVYSERRAVRAAIVNGNVVHEGADLGSGLVLQEIGPSGVVLAWRGNRYTVVY